MPICRRRGVSRSTSENDMLHRNAKSRRSGFTLLEIMLASAIGVLLLGGLYVSMDLQLRHAEAGREVVESTAVSRALLDRIGKDVALSLGPVVSQTTSTSSQTGAASQAASSPSATAQTAGTTSSTPNTTTPSSTTSSAPTVFNQGLQGDSGQLTIYVSRWPREAMIGADSNNLNPPAVSDLRRVTWWLTDQGLARQEILVATSDDSLSVPAPDLNDGYSKLVAQEVKNLQFRYYDPTSQTWEDSWDGTQPGADGVTPMGPPAAVEITITIAMPNPDGEGDLPLKEYRHVVLLHAANGLSAQAEGANTLNPNAQSSTGGATQP
jgi:prepilin-type N-terminal cleavage/methylation domain-containing protein